MTMHVPGGRVDRSFSIGVTRVIDYSTLDTYSGHEPHIPASGRVLGIKSVLNKHF